jgi:hypothetical protein
MPTKVPLLSMDFSFFSRVLLNYRSTNIQEMFDIFYIAVFPVFTFQLSTTKKSINLQEYVRLKILAMQINNVVSN